MSILNKRDAWMIRATCIALLCCSVARAEERTVEVALRLSSSTFRPIVRLRDIADVRGGSPALQQKVASLDLAELKPDSTEAVSKRQVDVRIRLAGIPKHTYRLTGAQSAVVTFRQPASQDDVVIQAFRQPLASHFHISPEDLELRLTRPLGDDTLFDSAAEVRPFIPNHVRPGRFNLEAGVYRRDRLVRLLRVSMEASVFRNVATAARRIERGTKLTEDDFQFTRRAVSGKEASNGIPRPLGKTVKRTLLPGDVIWETDFARESNRQDEYVVKPRDIVQLVVRKKNLTVVLRSAEVLQRGKLGDTVSVRAENPRRTLKGSVVSATEVVVPL